MLFYFLVLNLCSGMITIMLNIKHIFFALLLLATLGFAACRFVTPSPLGEKAEREKAVQAGAPFAQPVEKRALPDLATSASLPAVLEYAFNANGTIEAAYREWRGALERVPQAGALSDPKISFDFLFSNQNIKSFSQTFYKTINGMLEQDFENYGKREAKAQQALLDAQAAGERFRGEKYKLQKRVAQAYAALALNNALLDINAKNLNLLRRMDETASHRYHAMEQNSLVDLRKLEGEILKAESDRRALKISSATLSADLNAALNRTATAAWGAVALPEIVRPADTEAALFERAVQHNPELAALKKEIESRGAAQTLAELQKRPDYNVGIGVEEGYPKLSAGMTLPIYREKIRAGIAEALAMRQASEAKFRAAHFDVQGRVVIALSGLRDSERVIADYRERILPKTREMIDAQMSAYASGGGDLIDILDAQRLLLDFQTLIARAESDRLRYLADLEEALGEDLFDFHTP
ncbi:TPA: hypothetical protein DDW35_12195 [Candidatus Sumerlaeota bacterium]|nr:hypothetical protein [Candidatus Sumerlaeota bacterium]